MDKSVHPGWPDEAVTLWDAAELELETLEQPFQYHIEVDFPEDMYYYKNFQFQDELGSVHIIDKNNINLWLVDPEGEMSPLNLASYRFSCSNDIGFELIHEPVTNTIKIVGHNINKSTNLPGKDWLLRLKPNWIRSKICSIYDANARRISIPISLSDSLKVILAWATQ